MSKSKCVLCGKVLKAGEWMLKTSETGVIKVCIDKGSCQQRLKTKSPGGVK